MAKMFDMSRPIGCYNVFRKKKLKKVQVLETTFNLTDQLNIQYKERAIKTKAAVQYLYLVTKHQTKRSMHDLVI